MDRQPDRTTALRRGNMSNEQYRQRLATRCQVGRNADKLSAKHRHTAMSTPIATANSVPSLPIRFNPEEEQFNRHLFRVKGTPALY